MFKGYEYRIYPTDEQKTLINKTIGCTRFVYNKLLADYEEQKLQGIEKPKIKTPAKFKNEFEWLKEVDCQSLCNAQINIQAAYRRFWNEVFPKLSKEKNLKKRYKKKALKQFEKDNSYQFKLSDIKGYPKFHSKKSGKQSYTTNCINNSIRIENGKLRLPKVGLLRIVFHRYCIGQIKAVTVYRKCNKYYVSIRVEQEDKWVEPVKKENEKVLGIDMSLNCFAVYSDGTKAKYPKFYRRAEKRLNRLNKSISRKQDKSINQQKARNKYAVLSNHIANQRKNSLYNEAKSILKNYNVFVVEDINLQGMANKKCHHGKSIGDIGFGMFRTILERKASEIGGKLIKADRFFPSSQLCNICGYKNKEVKNLSVRRWKCPQCHTIHDRDVNAAINLVKYYNTTATVEIEDCGENVRPFMAVPNEAIKIVNEIYKPTALAVGS